MADGDRTALRAAARNELSVGSADTTIFTNEELNACIDEVTADFSRVLPRQQVYEYTSRQTVTAEAFTSAGSHGTWKALANKPIKSASEKVKLGAVTYTRDKDYEMDYANGQIRTISGGAMLVTTAYTIDYTKAKYAVDLTSLTDLIQVDSVFWPANFLPKSEVMTRLWNGTLYLEATDESQQSFADSQHIEIFYTARHTAPTDTVAASWARWLDGLAVKGAVAYALFIKAREQVIQAITDNDSGTTALAKVSAASNALDKLDTALASLTTAATGVYARLDAALTATEMTAARTAIKTALDKVLTYLEGASNSAKASLALITSNGEHAAVTTANNSAATYRTGVSSSALAALALITSGSERAAIETALGKIATYSTGVTDSQAYALKLITTAKHTAVETALGKIITYLATTNVNVASVVDALTKIRTDTLHADVDLALDAVATYLTGVSNSAKAALALIASGAEYAASQTSLAAGLTAVSDASSHITSADNVWLDEVKHLLTATQVSAGSNAQSSLDTGVLKINSINLGTDTAGDYHKYALASIEIAKAWAQKREDFIREAAALANNAQADIQQALGILQKVERMIEESHTWQGISQTFIQEAQQRLTRIQAYLSEATEWGKIAQGFTEEARVRIAEIEAYVLEASGWQKIAQSFLEEARTRVEKITTYKMEADGWEAISAGYNRTAETVVGHLNAYVVEAERWVSVATGFIAEAAQRRAHVEAFMVEAQHWENKGQLYIQEAQQWLGKARAYVEQALGYRQSADSRFQIAERLLADAKDRHAAYWQALAEKAQNARHQVRVSRRQYADNTVPVRSQPTGSET